jgi:mRNA interferase MazF
VPLTSKVSHLPAGEFVIADRKAAGLNVPSAVKRGLYTIHQSLVMKVIGKLSDKDASSLEISLRDWLGLH